MEANGDLEDQILQERDVAEDAIQVTHIALGGDGEWACRIPCQEPPNSGDLLRDVPALAEERMDELTAAIRDRDAGWAAAEKLCESLRHVHAYLIKSGNLSDADELAKVILWFAAARAKRNPNSEI